MMDAGLKTAFTAGYERVCAWADLLDQINVFPVADADTGRNLVISLAPLHGIDGDIDSIVRQLLMSATGNSGNIANSFFSGFLEGDLSKGMLSAGRSGRNRAWHTVMDPQPGTMLTVFDEFVDHFKIPSRNNKDKFYLSLIDRLKKAVHSTSDVLPTNKAAGVVDAGALGIYIFMEGFFSTLVGEGAAFRPVTETFQGKLTILSSFKADTEDRFCVDTVLVPGADSETSLKKLSEIGDSIVVMRDSENLKIHFHTNKRAAAREHLQELGRVIQWSEEGMGPQIKSAKMSTTHAAVRIVTDAAGSVTRQDAREHAMTLLDSYIIIDGKRLPETLVSPAKLYRSMRKGLRVTTAQASVFERRQRYRSIISRYRQALYLCVGSIYTGNFETVTTWKKRNDPEDGLTVVDTLSASGRLGIVALAVARYANQGHNLEKVVRFSQIAVEQSREYVFLDRLKYLVAGGRLSKKKGFMGDLLNLKPVISLTDEGAVKAGTVRNRGQQLEFALEKLNAAPLQTDALSIMLEYTDNRQWVEKNVWGEIRDRYPSAHVILQPLSLTSGAHMGPGAWGVAFLSLPGQVLPI